jgi:hypothetical protein
VTSVDAKLISSLDTERFGTCLVRIQQVNFKTVEWCIEFFALKSTGELALLTKVSRAFSFSQSLLIDSRRHISDNGLL